MELRARDLGLAAILAAALHVAALVAMFTASERSGSVSAGEGGLTISTRLAGVAAVGDAAEDESAPAEPEPPETVAEEAPTEATAQDAPAEATAQAAAAEVTAHFDEPVVAAPEPNEVATAAPDAAAAERATEIAAEPPPETSVVASEPPKPEARAERRQPQRRDTQEQNRQRGAQAVVGDAGASNRRTERRDASGGGDPGAKRDYLARVAAQLSRRKRYPSRARSRREEGVGRLYILIGADGRVLRSQLRSSTGHEPLDQEILSMLRRAQPFPPIPSDVGARRLELVVPIRFALR